MKTISVIALLVLLGHGSAFAASCDVYPEGIGQTVVDTPAGIKIVSTAQASVPLDDTDLYMDGITEATMEAKASISAFINETVSKECESNRRIESNVNITAEGKAVDVKKVKTIVCSLRNKTSALLKGVVVLGTCYTPGKFVRVTVGIKPETISQARQMSAQIKRSPESEARDKFLKSQPSGPLNNMNGYSDDKRLYDF